MKKAFLVLLLILGSTFLNNSHAEQKLSPLQSLHGAYTSLPLELKELSIIDGAIALETKFIERLYKETESDKVITKPSLNLIKNLFYMIPGTNDFGLSKNIFKEMKKNQIEETIKKFIQNLSALFLIEEVEKHGPQLHKGNEAKQYNNTIKKLKNRIVAITPLTKESFLAASHEIARFALLASLWFIKKNIQDFDYEKLLQEEIKNACAAMLLQNKIPGILTEKIEAINDQANSIEKTKDAQYDIEETFQKTESLLSQNTITTLSEDEYEALLISFVAELLGTTKHPQIIRQTKKAKVFINEMPFSFLNCVEISLFNVISYLAYNEEVKQISTTYLQSKFPNTPQPVIDFYKKYEKTINMNLLEDIDQLKNEWSALACQIPGIKYKKNICEIEANTVNIIIALNHLLGLNLFDELNNYPEDELFFIEHHLPKVIKLFEPFKTVKINHQKIDDWGEIKNQKIVLDAEYNDIEIIKQQFSLLLEIREEHCVFKYPTKFIVDKEFAKNLYLQYPTLYLVTPINRWPLILGPTTRPSFLPFFAHPIDQKKFVCELENNLKNYSYFWISRLEKLVQKHCSKEKVKTFTNKMYRIALDTIEKENISQQNKLTIIKKNLENVELFFNKTLPLFTQLSLHGGRFFGQSFLQTNFDLLKTMIEKFYDLDNARINNSAIGAINAIYKLQPLMTRYDVYAMLSLTRALFNANSQDEHIRSTAQKLAEDILQEREKIFDAAQTDKKIKQKALRLLKKIKPLD